MWCHPQDLAPIAPSPTPYNMLFISLYKSSQIFTFCFSNVRVLFVGNCDAFIYFLLDVFVFHSLIVLFWVFCVWCYIAVRLFWQWILPCLRFQYSSSHWLFSKKFYPVGSSCIIHHFGFVRFRKKKITLLYFFLSFFFLVFLFFFFLIFNKLISLHFFKFFFAYEENFHFDSLIFLNSVSIKEKEKCNLSIKKKTFDIFAHCKLYIFLYSVKYLWVFPSFYNFLLADRKLFPRFFF